jgi:hypothetical protein
MLFNDFATMPYIPYKIIEYLANNNENIWKLMAYGTYDALTKPNLTLNEKLALVWKGESKQESYNVFLNRTVNNAEPNATTILKLYRYETNPKDHLKATLSYEFDVLFGSKISLVEYNDIPCNRGDVFEEQILSTLNGTDVGGVGVLQFNHKLSTLARSGMNIGNNSTYSGVSIIMNVQVGTVAQDGYL